MMNPHAGARQRRRSRTLVRGLTSSFVVKVGGGSRGRRIRTARRVVAILASGRAMIAVHGGGPQVTE
jgi:hypothetical protein